MYVETDLYIVCLEIIVISITVDIRKETEKNFWRNQK